MSNTEFFVVAAPGHYGDTTKVLSAHRSLAAARKAAGAGRVVRRGRLERGEIFYRDREWAHPIARSAAESRIAQIRGFASDAILYGARGDSAMAQSAARDFENSVGEFTTSGFFVYRLPDGGREAGAWTAMRAWVTAKTPW